VKSHQVNDGEKYLPSLIVLPVEGGKGAGGVKIKNKGEVEKRELTIRLPAEGKKGGKGGTCQVEKKRSDQAVKKDF